MNQLSGIYCIENLVNGDKYIGQSRNVRKRMTSYHSNCHALLGAIKKYGKKNFKNYIIVLCEDVELNRLEIECIKIFSSHVNEKGYNISLGGSIPNLLEREPVSEETCKKLSDNHADFTGENNPNFGRKWKSASSQYFGVYLHKNLKHKCWHSRIWLDKKQISIGYYKTEKEAALAYDNYIIENNLPNPLNFPQ